MASIIAIKQTLPTYLKEFLRQDTECILIHRKAPSKSSLGEEFKEEWSFSSELKSSLNLNNMSMESELELTGNPLHIDLDESVIVTFPTESDLESPPNWTVAESQHVPMSLNDARNLLNTKYNYKQSAIPIFCITDGKDKAKTVVIGSHNAGHTIITYLGQIMGAHSYNDEELTLENLLKDHYNYVRVKADSTQYNFMRVYNIHGFAIQETPALEYSKYNGCMFLETSWNIFSKEEPSINETRMKLILKVVSGHKESAIHFMWKQLGQLQECLNILSDTALLNNGDTPISDDYLSISDLTANIHQLCCSNLSKKRKINIDILDYSDLRENTILDNVWVLLNKCQSLKDLKSLFSMFFMMVKLENYGSSNAILSIQKCLETNVDYISQLTFAESLKLLVYIGFEKLKEDYFTISNFYQPIHQGVLEKKWSELHVQNEEKTRRVTGGVRNLAINDTSFNDRKMKYLLQLHDTAEMLTFLKHDVEISSELSSDNFSAICKQIYDQNILNKSSEQGEFGMKVKLIELTCDLNPRNNQLYKNGNSVASIYDITSKVHTCTIKTIFHIAEFPTFPKIIFDNYGIEDKSNISADEELHPLRYKSKLIVSVRKVN